MLSTNTTISIQGTSKHPETQQEIMTFEARLEYDGSVNNYKRYPNRKLYNDNKALADADLAKFEEYANALIDKVTAATSDEEG